MEIKGTAVKSTKNFVSRKFPNQYQIWLNALPEETRKYYQVAIMSGEWFSLQEAILIPTRVCGELFYDGNIAKAGFEMGRESALEALRGIYKIFVKIASVDFVLKRVKTIFATYYSSGVFDIVSQDKNKIEFFVSGFQKGEELIYDRISGWIEGIFSVIAPEKITVTYSLVEEGNNINCEIFTIWE